MVEALPVTIPFPQFLMILIVVIAIGILLSRIFAISIRVVIAVSILVGIIGIGYYWLPQVLSNVLNGNDTAANVANGVVNDFAHSGIMEAIGQAWTDITTTIANFFNQ